jgi:phosphoribosylaminoimidazole-succinocarboxamide synthase
MTTSSPAAASPPLLQSQLSGLRRLHQGKVRDIYEVDKEHMLIVTTDRLSAFDVVLPNPIPGKGRVLTQLADFWFRRTTHIVPNQLTDYPLEKAVLPTNWRSVRHYIAKRP